MARKLALPEKSAATLGRRRTIVSLLVAAQFSSGCVGLRLGYRKSFVDEGNSGAYWGGYGEILVPPETSPKTKLGSWTQPGGVSLGYMEVPAVVTETSSEPVAPESPASPSERKVVRLMRHVPETSLAAVSSLPLGHIAGRHHDAFPSAHIGVSWGTGFGVFAGLCYGAYGVYAHGFLCGRVSTQGWVSADASVGTNLVSAAEFLFMTSDSIEEP